MADLETKRDNQRTQTLLEILKQDLKNQNLGPQERCDLLEELKILGRQPDHAVSINDRDAIDTVAQHALDRGVTDASREALRTLANSFLLRPRTKTFFVDLGYATKVIARLGARNSDDEFLCSRVLFFLTYDTNANFSKLTVDQGLGQILCERVRDHAFESNQAKSVGFPAIMTQDPALSEILKLMFFLTHYFPASRTYIAPAQADVLTLLSKEYHTVVLPLDPPMCHLVNIVLNLQEAEGDDAQLFERLQESDINTLISILRASLQSYSPEELDSAIAPITTLLLKTFKTASSETRKLFKTKLLPTSAERDLPLGQSDTTFARLMKLSTSGQMPTLRNLIPQLMFELSDNNPNTFVHNVGYGYASGFLVNNGIDASELQRRAQTSNSVGANGHTGASAQPDTNFVTGQYLDQEPQEESPPMTDEEKEREAEKLFVLFERLKRNGVIDVVNPVETAAREGRFEEID